MDEIRMEAKRPSFSPTEQWWVKYFGLESIRDHCHAGVGLGGGPA